jgi:hypothetical protein
MVKRTLILLAAFLFVFNVSAQHDTLKTVLYELRVVKNNFTQIQKSNYDLNLLIKSQGHTIDSLKSVVATNTLNIQQTADSLGIKITRTEKTTAQQYSDLDSAIGKNTLIGIIAFLLVALITLLFFLVLRKRQSKDKSEILEKTDSTIKSLEEKQVELYAKVAEIYNEQLKLLSVQPKKEKVDHSLALKFADEMVKMQMNITYMDQNVKGLKQLKIALGNMNDNFKANGYEIIDHLNKPYHEGSNMQATMEPDPSLKEGEFIIRRIIKPEVHFDNKMIQNAQVIVAFGE